MISLFLPRRRRSGVTSLLKPACCSNAARTEDSDFSCGVNECSSSRLCSLLSVGIRNTPQGESNTRLDITVFVKVNKHSSFHGVFIIK